MTKICKRCNEEKNLNRFAKHGSNKSGFSLICKDCINTRNRNKYIKKSTRVITNWEELFNNFHKGVYPYLGSDRNLSINSHCKVHGYFKVAKIYLKTGSGCPKCFIKRRTKTLEQFILDAEKVHGKVYDYSKAIYVQAHTKLIIICKEHGEWLTKPCAHLRGNGCPTCATIVRNTAYRGILERDATKISCYVYLNEFKNEYEHFYKIGISTNMRSRYRSRKIDYNIKTLLQIKMNLYGAISLEQKILKELKDEQYIPLQTFGGKFECFNNKSLNKIILKINENKITETLYEI